MFDLILFLSIIGNNNVGLSSEPCLKDFLFLIIEFLCICVYIDKMQIKFIQNYSFDCVFAIHTIAFFFGNKWISICLEFEPCFIVEAAAE